MDFRDWKIDLEHPNCLMADPISITLAPGEQILTRRYPPEIAFHPARLARIAYGIPPALVLFGLSAST